MQKYMACNIQFLCSRKWSKGSDKHCAELLTNSVGEFWYLVWFVFYARLNFGVRKISLLLLPLFITLERTGKTKNADTVFELHYRKLAPDYLQRLFTQRHVNDYNLRNLEGKLSLPKPNTNYLKRSFCYSGACLWNNLPQDLKSVCSIGQFKRGIKKVSEISDSHTAIM